MSMIVKSQIFSFYMQCFCFPAVMPNFAEKVEVAVDALSYNPPREVDENEFIDASRLVYDGVRDIRQAVLLDRVISSVDIMLVIVWQFKQCIEGT